MKIEPLEDNVLVRPDDPESRTEGGIYIPNTAKKKSQSGTVVAVGPGKVTDSGVFIEALLKPGEKVIYHKYAGADLEVDGQLYRIMRSNEIVCTVEG